MEQTTGTTPASTASNSGTGTATGSTQTPTLAESTATEARTSGGLGTLSLKSKGTETTETPETSETKTETPEEKVTEKKFAGKYESIEDFEKGYAEAVAKITEQAEQLKSATPHEVPEDYSIEKMTDVGLSFKDEAQHTAVAGVLKEAKLSQDQFDKIMPAARQLAETNFEQGVNHSMEMHGYGQAQIQEQLGKLRESWGDATDSRMKFVTENRQHIPDDFWNLPAKNTSLGWEMAENFLKSKLGPNHSSDVTPSGPSEAELRNQLFEISMQQRKVQHGPEAQALAAKSRQIASQIAATKKR